jgi:Bacterial Ig-like domain (group 3)
MAALDRLQRRGSGLSGVIEPSGSVSRIFLSHQVISDCLRIFSFESLGIWQENRKQITYGGVDQWVLRIADVLILWPFFGQEGYPMRLTFRLRSLLFLVVASSFHSAFPQSASVTQVVTQAVPTEILSVVPAGNNGSVQFHVQILGAPAGVPTGSITYTLSPSDASKAPTTTVLSLKNGEAQWETSAPSGNYTISATYSGDTNYQPTSSASTGSGQSLPADFDFVTSTIVLKQGKSWSGAIQMIPINGFAKTVSFVCSAPAALSCNLGTASYTFAQPNGAPSPNTIPLTIITYSGEFITSAFLLLPVLTLGRQRGMRVRLGVIGAVALFFSLALFGCGESNRAGWQPITPKGKYRVLITGTAAGVQHSKELTVIVD